MSSLLYVLCVGRSFSYVGAVAPCANSHASTPRLVQSGHPTHPPLPSVSHLCSSPSSASLRLCSRAFWFRPGCSFLGNVFPTLARLLLSSAALCHPFSLRLVNFPSVTWSGIFSSLPHSSPITPDPQSAAPPLPAHQVPTSPQLSVVLCTGPCRFTLHRAGCFTFKCSFPSFPFFLSQWSAVSGSCSFPCSSVLAAAPSLKPSLLRFTLASHLRDSFLDLRHPCGSSRCALSVFLIRRPCRPRPSTYCTVFALVLRPSPKFSTALVLRLLVLWHSSPPFLYGSGPVAVASCLPFRS